MNCHIFYHFKPSRYQLFLAYFHKNKKVFLINYYLGDHEFWITQELIMIKDNKFQSLFFSLVYFSDFGNIKLEGVHDQLKSVIKIKSFSLSRNWWDRFLAFELNVG